MADLTALENRLDYRFSDSKLLLEALTPPAVRGADYERLEFLGDRVLALSIADQLLKTYPQAKQGELSKRLMQLVRKEALAALAEQIGLIKYLQGPAALKQELQNHSSVQADMLEALLGAVYLDGGWEATHTMILKLWKDMLRGEGIGIQDAKSSLQEWLQGRGLKPPVYNLRKSEGAAHKPVFFVEISAPGLPEVIGQGASKKLAEQDAASKALKLWMKI
ncbi:MAG: ribonuclease III [Dongiaceae bacterium]